MKIVDHEARRLELAEAVLTVIARDGIGSVSVRSVAAEAGWSYGVITHYFKDRDDLLLFAYRLALQREIELLPTEQELPDPVDRLSGSLLRMLPIDEDAHMDFTIWLGFMGRVADNPDLAASVAHEHEGLHQRVRSLVQQCMDVGAFPHAHDAASVAEFLTIFVDGLGVAAALDPSRYSRDRLAELVRAQVGHLRRETTCPPTGLVPSPLPWYARR